MVGIFCGVLLGIGKLSDNLGTIILENGGNQTGVRRPPRAFKRYMTDKRLALGIPTRPRV